MVHGRDLSRERDRSEATQKRRIAIQLIADPARPRPIPKLHSNNFIAAAVVAVIVIITRRAEGGDED